jgi:hypothetical protein
MEWGSRPARISRLREKTHFDQVVVPLAYAGAAVASLFLFWQGLQRLEDNPTHEAIWIPALFFALLPVPLAIYRWFRKHHHPKLHAQGGAGGWIWRGGFGRLTQCPACT